MKKGKGVRKPKRRGSKRANGVKERLGMGRTIGYKKAHPEGEEKN